MILKFVCFVHKENLLRTITYGIITEAGADGILLIASVLGPALENFLNLATVIGLGKLLHHVIALYVMLR